MVVLQQQHLALFPFAEELESVLLVSSHGAGNAAWRGED